MDKRIEEVVNEQLNTEIWSSDLYMVWPLICMKMNCMSVISL